MAVFRARRQARASCCIKVPDTGGTTKVKLLTGLGCIIYWVTLLTHHMAGNGDITFAITDAALSGANATGIMGHLNNG